MLEGFHWRCLDEPNLMAGLEFLLNEFRICHRLECFGCELEYQKNYIRWVQLNPGVTYHYWNIDSSYPVQSSNVVYAVPANVAFF